MEYKEKFRISKNKLNNYNDLLSLDLEDCLPYYNEYEIKRLGARQNDYIGIAIIEFENNNYITIDLVSGDSNYYDNIVLYDEKGNELYVLDCDFKLDGFEFTYDNDTYIIELEIDE